MGWPGFDVPELVGVGDLDLLADLLLLLPLLLLVLGCVG